MTPKVLAAAVERKSLLAPPTEEEDVFEAGTPPAGALCWPVWLPASLICFLCSLALLAFLAASSLELQRSRR